MGERDDGHEWQELDQAVRSAFDLWLKGQPWHATSVSWFSEGRSDSPVGLLERSGPARTDEVVIKFFSKGAEEVRAWKAAIDGAPEPFGALHLAPLVEADRLTDDCGPWVGVVGLVRGDLTKFRPVADLGPLHGKDAVRICESVVRSVLREWNPNPRPAGVEVLPVADYLARMCPPKRAAPGSRLTNWAAAADVPLDNPLVVRQSALMPNPIALCRDANLTEGRRVKVQIGRAHGDLNVRNIFAELRPLRPDRFVLIDLGGYGDREPLARDPIDLLLSAAAEWILEIVPDSRMASALAAAIVDPSAELTNHAVKPYRDVAAVVRETGRKWAADQSMGHHWTEESLLALTGRALTFAGRKLRMGGQAEDKVRGWFYDLAAVAAHAYLTETGGWTEYVNTHATNLPSKVSLLHRPSTTPGPAPHDPHADLRRQLEHAHFDQASWTRLAVSFEALRGYLAQWTSAVAGRDSTVDDLVRALERTVVAVLNPNARHEQIVSACRTAEFLRAQLLDLLAP